MAVFLQGACILSFIAAIASLSEAMVCLMGQEPDSIAAHRYRWVIPVEDPCKCTEIRPGGLNNRAPKRHFKVIYFDTFLISNSPKEIRKWLNCSDVFRGNQVKSTAVSASISGTLMSSVPASHSTGNAPSTSNIPVTSFTCPGGGVEHYADPNSATMYYRCDGDGKAHHLPCPAKQTFNGAIQECV